jgi:hypothetical protein
MNRAFTMLLNLILLVLGAVIVYSFPLNPLAIAIGMLFLAVSILSIALQVYFPPQPKHVVLRVVEPVAPLKRVVKRKRVRRAKKKVRKRKKAKKTKRTRRTRKRR